MLAVVSIQMLVRVEDEEEAGEMAMKMETGAREGAARELAALVLKDGLDLNEINEKLETMMAFLGPQVTILPEVVVNG